MNSRHRMMPFVIQQDRNTVGRGYSHANTGTIRRHSIHTLQPFFPHRFIAVQEQFIYTRHTSLMYLMRNHQTFFGHPQMPAQEFAISCHTTFIISTPGIDIERCIRSPATPSCTQCAESAYARSQFIVQKFHIQEINNISIFLVLKVLQFFNILYIHIIEVLILTHRLKFRFQKRHILVFMHNFILICDSLQFIALAVQLFP